MLDSIRTYFNAEEPPTPHVHVGMRMIKSVIAVLICGTAGWALGLNPLLAMIAALLSVQRSMEKTLVAAFDRVLATVIGGVFGLGALYIGHHSGLIYFVVYYYALVALLIIPVMVLTILIRKSSISGLASVVMICVSVLSSPDGEIYRYAMDRLLLTAMGVVTAAAVNFALPPYGRKRTEHENAPQTDPVEEEKPDVDRAKSDRN